MTTQPSDPDDSGRGRARGSSSGVPRWVKVFVVVAVAIAVLGVVAMLLVGGEHGPGRHRSATLTSHQLVVTASGWDLR